MKRKIFSKLLMGALLVASVSSFTSCKDYDDDINSLKESVAKAALQSNLDALTTTVNGVKSTADQALTTANAAATKAELSAAKSEALAKAAEGITNAATAQAAADAAKALAQEAKTAAESIDLTPYVTKTELAATAEAAKTEITNALANYLTADAIEKKLADLKQEIADANEEQLAEMQAKVKNATEAVNSIWSAVTSVSLYAAMSPTTAGVAAGTGNGIQTFDGTTGVLNLQFVKDAIDNTKARFTRGTLSTVTAPTANYATKGDGVFGIKDYFANAEAYSASKVEFVDEAIFKFPTAIIVRVSPTNAVLSKENVSIVDGKGAVLSQVEVASVEPYSALLTRAGSASGLWKINLCAVDNATIAKFQAATRVNANGAYSATGAKQGLFAVAINNTKDVEAAAERNIVSEYGITIDMTTPITAYKGVYDLRNSAKVNDAVLNTVGGRNSAGAQTTISGAKSRDYVWNAYNPTNVVASSGIDRTGLDAVAIKNGGKVTVDLTNSKSSTDDATSNNGPFRPQYYYVTRDDANAGGSDASELNAWKSYSYSGNLNTILDPATEKCEFTITIPEGSATGDYIGFRIFAVNYDGTLCDPDGVPFEVWVGANQSAADIAESFVPTQETGFVTDAYAFAPADAGAFPTGGAGTVTLKVNGTDWTVGYQIKKSNGTANATSWSDSKKIVFNLPATSISTWKDGATGTGTMTFKDANNAPVQVISVALTKKMPDADFVKAKYGYSWKDKQLVDGVYTAYVYPESAAGAADNTWTTAAQPFGYKDLNQALNGLAGNADRGTKITISNARLKAVGTKNYYQDPLVIGGYGAAVNYNMDVNNAKDDNNVYLIDNTTQHDMKISYIFKDISSETDGNDWDVSLEDVKIVFACPLAAPAQTFAWSQLNLQQTAGKADKFVDINYLYYNEPTSRGKGLVWYADETPGAAVTPTQVAFRLLIQATNTYDNTVFGGTLTAAGAHYVRIATVAAGDDAKYAPKLTSDSNGNEDYFTITAATFAAGFTFAANSSATNPTADVPSHLTFYLLDAFGHYNKVSLPFVVKRAI